LTGSFLKSLERSPDETLCQGVVSSHVHPTAMSPPIRSGREALNLLHRPSGRSASSSVASYGIAGTREAVDRRRDKSRRRRLLPDAREAGAGRGVREV